MSCALSTDDWTNLHYNGRNMTSRWLIHLGEMPTAHLFGPSNPSSCSSLPLLLLALLRVSYVFLGQIFGPTYICMTPQCSRTANAHVVYICHAGVTNKTMDVQTHNK